MWLMTRHGFYSIVQKDDGIHIRTRERMDLDRLLTGIADRIGRDTSSLKEGLLRFDLQIQIGECTWQVPFVESLENDYRYRVIVDQALLQIIMAWLTRTCDYPNFKAQINSDPTQRRKPYHAVWEVMARALGAYGRKGGS